MKLRNKLILSCAALAAVATTAVSTTYAWYTSNDEVTASNISGASANSGSELLLISADKTHWGTSIEDVIEDPSTELTPLAYVQNSTPTGTDKTSNVLVGMTTNASKKVVTAAAAADANGYVGFTVYLKNASTTAKALNMNIVSLTNTSTELPSKPVIGNGAQFLGLASSAANYTVNALRVLAMDLEVYSTTDGSTFTFVSEAAYDFENITTNTIFDVSKVNGATAADSLASKTAGTITPAEEETYSAGTNFNAHQYYNSIMSPDSVIEDTTADPTTFADTLTTAGKIPGLVSSTNFKTAGTAATANNFLMIKGKIFLNGWDLACFDACQGQTFDLDISFDVKES